uniref:ARAD1B14586p n=1 Tax=Blastobotrys adeninivorans TaxID=409370 RepID=A0A060T6T0_BLAAD
MDSLGGILDSIRDVEKDRFEVDSMKRSLEADWEPEDVVMADASEDVVANTLGGLSLQPQSRLPSQPRRHMLEQDIDDVEMEDAPVANTQQHPESSPRRVKMKDMLSPTSLGAQLAEHRVVLFGGQDEAKGVDEKDQMPDNDSKKGVQENDDATGTSGADGDTDRTEEITRAAADSAVGPSSTYNGEYRYPMDMPWPRTNDNTPYIISTYLQLAFNMFMVCIILYLVSRSLVVLWRDVDAKLESYSNNLMVDISQCTMQYLENNCRPDIRPPALHDECSRLEKCMEQDPSGIGRAKVTAETIAEIINSFVEPFTMKTTIVAFTLFVLVMFLSNLFFGFIRAKSYYHDHPTIQSSGQSSSKIGLLSHPPNNNDNSLSNGGQVPPIYYQLPVSGVSSQSSVYHTAMNSRHRDQAQSLGLPSVSR